jgi:hypothetical protein
LHGIDRKLSKATGGFPERFRKAICSSLAALKQLVNIAATGVGQIHEDSEPFERGEIKLVSKYKIN